MAEFETGAYKCECVQGFEYPYEDYTTYFDGQASVGALSSAAIVTFCSRLAPYLSTSHIYAKSLL